MAKGRISKRVFQENKACQIFRKTNISSPETPVLRFALLPYYRRTNHFILYNHQYSLYTGDRTDEL